MANSAAAPLKYHRPSTRGTARADPLTACVRANGLDDCDSETQESGEYLFRARGLDASKTYRATLDNSGQTIEATGFELQQLGIRVDLAPLTSELLLFEEKAR